MFTVLTYLFTYLLRSPADECDVTNSLARADSMFGRQHHTSKHSLFTYLLIYSLTQLNPVDKSSVTNTLKCRPSTTED